MGSGLVLKILFLKYFYRILLQECVFFFFFLFVLCILLLKKHVT